MKGDRIFAYWLAVTAVAACSSDGDIVPKKERFTPNNVPDASPAVDAAPDASPDLAADGKKPRDPNANCIKPGTPPNERGVGGYCEPHRGDCESDAGPRFCTADFSELTMVPEYHWFCSTVCTMDEECGTGAVCAANEIGNGCVPLVCRGDAGASFDAATVLGAAP